SPRLHDAVRRRKRSRVDEDTGPCRFLVVGHEHFAMLGVEHHRTKHGVGVRNVARWRAIKQDRLPVSAAPLLGYGNVRHMASLHPKRNRAQHSGQYTPTHLRRPNFHLLLLAVQSPPPVLSSKLSMATPFRRNYYTCVARFSTNSQ